MRNLIAVRWTLLSLTCSTLWLLSGCGGGAGPDPVPTATPTPAPAPVTSVVAEGTLTGLPARELSYLPFTTSATGTIGVIADWTFATNNLDVYLVRGTDPCTADQFNSGTCAFLGFSESTTAKPEKLNVSGLAAGTYTVYVGNRGPDAESLSVQVLLTSVPGAAATESVSQGLHGGKGGWQRIIAIH
jgi:hypothetical protein